VRLPKPTKRFSLGSITLLQLLGLRHRRYSALVSLALTAAHAQAGNAIASLKKSLKPEATVKRNGLCITINAGEVVPGDIVLLGAGQAVPADCKLLAGKPIQVDQAALTGESLPVTMTEGSAALMGSTVRGPTCRLPPRFELAPFRWLHQGAVIWPVLASIKQVPVMPAICFLDLFRSARVFLRVGFLSRNSSLTSAVDASSLV